jgi:hypothetical protein
MGARRQALNPASSEPVGDTGRHAPVDGTSSTVALPSSAMAAVTCERGGVEVQLEVWLVLETAHPSKTTGPSSTPFLATAPPRGTQLQQRVLRLSPNPPDGGLADTFSLLRVLCEVRPLLPRDRGAGRM